MRYEARVTAFDMLDQVHVALAIFEAGEAPQASNRLVVTRVTTVRGEGESDPILWARDALLAMVEVL